MCFNFTAREFNIEDSEAMLRKHISWRKEIHFDKISTDYKPPEVLVKYTPTSFLGFDKEGCLVRYCDYGNADMKGLFNSVSKEDCMKYFIRELEKDLDLMRQHNKEFGKKAIHGIHIYNFENLTFSNATHKKALELGLQICLMIQDNYPERVKRIYHINSSIYHTLIMSILKSVLASALLKKILCFGSEGWQHEILKDIDADVLPAFLGGNRTDPDGNPMCNTFIIHGQIVPERYYFCNSEKRLFNSPDAKKITVRRFSKEEQTFRVKEVNSYLEWEFETMNKDIEFSIYFKDKSLENSKKESVELIPKQKINTYYEPEKGFLKCERVGIYSVVFDNSYSWIHSKEIYYKARIRGPVDEEIQKWN
ncbi:SEC14-like protein 2 [Nephila pilipes]|uniref:SEC14-like protein 2 n=1 Tax=Nephila pilipes TaxID=299642 RepID=A0A8X6KR38_NEPPI|nr:SEC14-like protein 2 [Nephila pilipes]